MYLQCSYIALCAQDKFPLWDNKVYLILLRFIIHNGVTIWINIKYCTLPLNAIWCFIVWVCKVGTSKFYPSKTCTNIIRNRSCMYEFIFLLLTNATKSLCWIIPCSPFILHVFLIKTCQRFRKVSHDKNDTTTPKSEMSSLNAEGDQTLIFFLQMFNRHLSTCSWSLFMADCSSIFTFIKYSSYRQRKSISGREACVLL